MSDLSADPLIQALNDEDSTVKANAAFSLGKVNTVGEDVCIPRSG